MKQTDLFPDMNRRVDRHEAPAMFAKLKTAVADMAFAADETDALASLCRIGNMAYLRHKDGMGGLCELCGSPSPRFLGSKRALGAFPSV